MHPLPRLEVAVAVSSGSSSLGQSGSGLHTGQCLAGLLAKHVAPGKLGGGRVGVRALAQDVLASH
eukprot:5351822-Pyramimonas_sp.AAC.1